MLRLHTRLFLNHMLKILRVCPLAGTVQLSPGFHKDLNWFRAYLQDSNVVYMIHEDTRTPIPIF